MQYAVLAAHFFLYRWLIGRSPCNFLYLLTKIRTSYAKFSVSRQGFGLFQCAGQIISTCWVWLAIRAIVRITVSCERMVASSADRDAAVARAVVSNPIAGGKSGPIKPDHWDPAAYPHDRNLQRSCPPVSTDQFHSEMRSRRCVSGCPAGHRQPGIVHSTVSGPPLGEDDFTAVLKDAEIKIGNLSGLLADGGQGSLDGQPVRSGCVYRKIIA